jgi:hypothetical protein
LEEEINPLQSRSIRLQKLSGQITGIDRMVLQHYFLDMASVSQIQKNLRAAMKDALRIQDRFVPEPVFAKTGRGYLKSEGVSTLHKIKAGIRHRSSGKAR